MNILTDLHRHATIKPIKPESRVRTVTKTSEGGLRVELNSGQTFDIGPDNELFQAFIVYTVLADL